MLGYQQDINNILNIVSKFTQRTSKSRTLLEYIWNIQIIDDWLIDLFNCCLTSTAMSDVFLEETCLQTSVAVGKRVILGWAYTDISMEGNFFVLHRAINETSYKLLLMWNCCKFSFRWKSGSVIFYIQEGVGVSFMSRPGGRFMYLIRPPQLVDDSFGGAVNRSGGAKTYFR